METEIKLDYEKVPSAYSMFMSAHNLGDMDFNVFPRYILTWTAFNSIYAYKARIAGLETQFRYEKSTGEIACELNGGVRIPQVRTIPEREQINCVISHFPDRLKKELINHHNTQFFVFRIPRWQGLEIEFDCKGQRVNGVINVSKTTDRNNPVWSPIDCEKYNAFKGGMEDEEVKNLLSKQIVYVLYSVRNNLVHGSKSTDDARDEEIVVNALPLLEEIVKTFLK